MRIIPLLAILTVALMTNAEAMADMIKMLGVGSVSCGTWTIGRRDRTAFGLEQWMLGFLSGAATWSPTLNPLNEVDADAVWVWVDNYCRVHPLDRITEAGKAFVIEHPH
jgi:hypothetical protein